MSQTPARSRWVILPAILLAVLGVAFVRLAFFGTRSCEFSGSTMGTTYSVKYLLRGGIFSQLARSNEIQEAVAQQLETVNLHMSTYRPDSELSRFNAHADDSPFPISGTILAVLEEARRVSDLTGGAFDITVGPVVNAYGFGPDPQRVELPDEEELDRLKQRVGYHRVDIDRENNTVRKQRPDIYCDLSAIAKGYGVDRVAEALEAAGISDYMIEVGGEVRARGRNARGLLWQIGLEKPVEGGRALHRVIELRDRAMATSGDYRNFYMEDGVRISHTIDPRTGRPVAHHLASVSVLDDRCMTADALATALMVLGPEQGYELAEKQSISALFLIRGNGAIMEKATSAFESEIARQARN